MIHDIHLGIKGLIFDLDGTLADTMPFHFKGWINASKRYGAEITAKFLNERAGFPSMVIADEIINSFKLKDIITSEQLLADKTNEFLKYKSILKPIEPVKEILIRYHNIIPVAIGTGGPKWLVEQIMEVTDISKYFEIIVTADDISNHKPHPETFLKCARLMNVSPSEIEVFEDTDFGLEAARSAGMIPIDVRSWYDSDLNIL